MRHATTVTLYDPNDNSHLGRGNILAALRRSVEAGDCPASSGSHFDGYRMRGANSHPTQSCRSCAVIHYPYGEWKRSRSRRSPADLTKMDARMEKCFASVQ